MIKTILNNKNKMNTRKVIVNNKIFLLVLLACWGLSSYATDPDNPCVETGYLGSWSDWSCTDGSVSITDPDPTEYLKCINDSFSLPSIEEEITDGSKTRTRTNTLTCQESSGYGAPTEETEDVPYQLDDEYWVDGDGTQVSDSITFTESGTYTYTPTVEISTSDSDCSSEPIEQTGSQITVYVPGFIPPSTICHNVDDDNDNTYADYSEGSSSVSGQY